MDWEDISLNTKNAYMLFYEKTSMSEVLQM